MKSVREVFAVLDKSARLAKAAPISLPIRSVSVFAQINAVRRKMRIKRLESVDLLFHRVPAIVDHNVEAWQLLLQARQEFFVGLIANEDSNLILLELFATGIYIDAKDFRLGTEVILPHLQRAALENANLQETHVGSAVF